MTDQVHRRFHVLEQDLAFRGKLYFFCAADEKSLVQFLLQYLDRLADRRLGDEKLLGCLGEA